MPGTKQVPIYQLGTHIPLRKAEGEDLMENSFPGGVGRISVETDKGVWDRVTSASGHKHRVCKP